MAAAPERDLPLGPDAASSREEAAPDRDGSVLMFQLK